MKISIAISAVIALLVGHSLAAPAPMPDSAPVLADSAFEARDIDMVAHDDTDDTDDDDFELDPETSALLDRLDSIPADVLDAGEDATASWLSSNLWVPHTERALSIFETDGTEGTLDLDARADKPFNAPKCLTAMGVALGMNAFPITKVVRIVKIFKKFGDMKKTISRFRAVRTVKGIRDVGGKELVELATIIAGVDAVATKCFPNSLLGQLLA
ncbi:hypothetical protein A1Q1_03663 [Trichosporon asahii var. asahii CBS 2479]|uniref:Secreted protein n=1 Tax=Trichosporon asahii var. asahii (strain ATCC 90039 / CBS 2479 / JCM 2466 / KCTC 7840 / NBRC 103889/ NCYC 2677 / UAMH 7654) TaxID=1186058 RepID=J5TSI5_TRIAS|nr:hypothetical protein A1Q1_03663 [Trichosporon asahii var. asahii CBS 2479]EJT52531.1 hypothetical protein A1Q1_03663 [Trichosporon asahii var. asahii CBS 2479]